MLENCRLKNCILEVFGMEINEKYHGFTITDKKDVSELNAVMYRFAHDKTGLELVWLKRDEENKTFGIAFETLPEDDTGVFHILEHSVLCGSEKYPLKEPFVELMKNSMNTFLNALTFPDKTMYPISSKNDKDFMNLVGVYLDAVFCPLIYKKPEIFRQEGWHLEFDENGKPSYNGVVFNEMKGAFSNPDELSETALTQALFPDTPYRFVSGGHPEHITDLTYEGFIAAHRRFYSPSNAYAFLDGNLDICAVLKLMDEEYLSKHEKTERIAPPAHQKPVSGPLTTIEYEVGTPEEESGRSRLVFGNVIGDYSTREKNAAMLIISKILCGNNQSPLCKAVLSAGLAEDVVVSINDEVMQSYIKLEARNIRTENADKVEAVIRDELKRIVEKGIDRELLDAAIANVQFQAMERDFGSYPQGLIFGFQIMASWLYGGDPAANLEVGDLFEDLKKKADEGYFEKLIDEVLLSNPHTAKVLLVPSHTLSEKRRASEEARIAKALDGISDEEKNKLVDMQKALTAWQTSDDSPEALAMMPTLALSDIETKPADVPTEVVDIKGVKILKHQLEHNGISYFKMYFAVNGLSEQELSELSFLTGLFGKLDTDKYTAEKLTNMIRKTYGTIDFFVDTFAAADRSDSCDIKLGVAFSTLTKDAEEAVDLAVHIMLHTKLDDTNAITDILRQTQTELYQRTIAAGHAVAFGRLYAQSDASGVVSECCGGIAYQQWLKTIDASKGFGFLGELFEEIIGTEGLVVSITGDVADNTVKAVESVIGQFPKKAKAAKTAVIAPWGASAEGIAIPAGVAYSAMGGNFGAHGGKYSTRLQLAAHIIGLNYLWNAVRVQGGAYGTGFLVRKTGYCGCWSYRDPSAAASLESFRASGEVLKKIMESGIDLTGSIIGTIADISPLLTVRMKGEKADAMYFEGVSYEDMCSRRKELLESTCEDIAEIAGLVDSVLKNGGICVVGSREQIDGCRDITNIITL